MRTIGASADAPVVRIDPVSRVRDGCGLRRHLKTKEFRAESALNAAFAAALAPISFVFSTGRDLRVAILEVGRATLELANPAQ